MMPSPIAHVPMRRSTVRHWEILVAVFIIVYVSISWLLTSENTLGDKVRIIPENSIAHFASNEVTRSAYVQYATSFEYLNLAIINFMALRKAGTKIPTLLILFNENLLHRQKFGYFSSQCRQLGITLKPVPLITSGNVDSSTWMESYTKFHIFNQVEYDRLVYFDADSMLVNVTLVDGQLKYKPNTLDELFNIPHEFNISLPHAYWIDSKQIIRYKPQSENNLASTFDELPTLISDQQVLSERGGSFFASHVMVITPSKQMFDELKSYISNPWYWHIFHRDRLKRTHDYDMEILNKYLQDSLRHQGFKIGILPHQVYGVLTGEFHQQSHLKFQLPPQLTGVKLDPQLQLRYQHWNALDTIQNIKLLHFSDSPIPKPWEDYTINEFTVHCAGQEPTNIPYQPRVISDCDGVAVWNWIRDQFGAVKQAWWIDVE